ncbi:efflux RND transporter periplasmic adaptor subunit [Bacillus smithii]|uniref:efflux RND transporter periplasmic adaptor subunit n=1 Tax=Bacillus smithii TaxID=1479 RepID=UPI0022E4F62F|nr:efflux RND transporter periplasmic adaptor subunit [Bacillus smithii]
MELERTEKVNTKKKWIVAGIAVLILLVVAINVIFMEKRKNETKSVQLMSVTKRPISNTKLISGQVVPGKVETIYLDPSKGKIKEIYVKEGQEVEKGQKLFTYENDDLNLQLKQASIDKKITMLNYNQVNDKIKALEKEKKAATDNASLSSLESQLEELESQKKTIELEMEKNQLQEEELQTKLNQLTIHSPINGYVKNLHPEESTEMTEEGTSSETMGLQGTPIMNIVSKEPFQIQGTLTELQKAQIQANQPIKVTANAVPNKSWDGKIVEVSEFPAATNSGTGQLSGEAGQSTSNLSYYTFKAKLHSQEGLSPGYHVAIQVVLSSKKVLTVPQNSVQEKGGSTFVYVMSKGKVQKRNITTGISTGEWTEVVDGLKEGEKVVKNPSHTMDSGMEVEIK